MSDTCDSMHLSGNRGGTPCGNQARPIGEWPNNIRVCLCPAHLGYLRSYGGIAVAGGPDGNAWSLNRRIGGYLDITGRRDRVVAVSSTNDVKP